MQSSYVLNSDSSRGSRNGRGRWVACGVGRCSEASKRVTALPGVYAESDDDMLELLKLEECEAKLCDEVSDDECVYDADDFVEREAALALLRGPVTLGGLVLTGVRSRSKGVSLI